MLVICVEYDVTSETYCRVPLEELVVVEVKAKRLKAFLLAFFTCVIKLNILAKIIMAHSKRSKIPLLCNSLNLTR